MSWQLRNADGQPVSFLPRKPLVLAECTTEELKRLLNAYSEINPESSRWEWASSRLLAVRAELKSRAAVRKAERASAAEEAPCPA